MDKAFVSGLAVLGVLALSGPPGQAAQPKPGAVQTIEDPKRFAAQTGLVRASVLTGAAVKDAAGKDAGKVEDLMIDTDGRVAYAVMAFGGALRIGERLFAVPWSAAWVNVPDRTVVVDVSKETLSKAPSFERDRWPDTRDRRWTEDVRRVWTDASITASVKARLAAERAATLVSVDVDTAAGVVQLNGRVDSERVRQRATELAQQVDGVRQVVNKLKVQG